MANLNTKPDYYDYLAGELNKIQEYNERLSERVDEIMYGNKILRVRKQKIQKLRRCIIDSKGKS